jgi:hypothetical protein
MQLRTIQGGMRGEAFGADLAMPHYLLIWLPATPTNKRSPPRAAVP